MSKYLPTYLSTSFFQTAAHTHSQHGFIKKISSYSTNSCKSRNKGKEKMFIIWFLEGSNIKEQIVASLDIDDPIQQIPEDELHAWIVPSSKERTEHAPPKPHQSCLPCSERSVNLQ